MALIQHQQSTERTIRTGLCCKPCGSGHLHIIYVLREAAGTHVHDSALKRKTIWLVFSPCQQLKKNFFKLKKNHQSKKSILKGGGSVFSFTCSKIQNEVDCSPQALKNRHVERLINCMGPGTCFGFLYNPNDCQHFSLKITY